jgi:hypothetical protein
LGIPGVHTRGAIFKKIRQRNIAETPLVILIIKKKHETKKGKKSLKKAPLMYPCGLILKYMFKNRTGDVIGYSRAKSSHP